MAVGEILVNRKLYIGLSPRIGVEIFGNFGFKSKDTKLVRKYLVGKILENGSRFAKFINIFPATYVIALASYNYDILYSMQL